MHLLLTEAKPGWTIPDDPGFRTAFLITTILYILAMIVLLVLFQRAMKKVPRSPKKERRKKRTAGDGFTNRPHTPRPPESETDSDR
ncbi:MAG: hypothetical protein IJ512_07740 [Ruminococcus sp.]|nr:hypothetical protein [Ruminococcus sp.]